MRYSPKIWVQEFVRYFANTQKDKHPVTFIGSRTNAGVPNIRVDKRSSVKILIYLSISIQVRLRYECTNKPAAGVRHLKKKPISWSRIG